MGGEHMGWEHMGDGWWWAPVALWWLLPLLLVIVGVVVLVVWLARSVGDDGAPESGASDGGDAGTTPRDILDARYARGEIDRESYLQARRDLEDGSRGGG